MVNSQSHKNGSLDFGKMGKWMEEPFARAGKTTKHSQNEQFTKFFGFDV